MKTEHCGKCEHSNGIFAQDGFMFLGCKFPPYRGKWVAQIEECPKEKKPTEKGGAE